MARNVTARFTSVRFATELEAFGEAMGSCPPDVAKLAAARNDLLLVGGEHALLDAAGVVGMFLSITKIVDCTGHRSKFIGFAARFTEGLVDVRAQWKWMVIIVLCMVTLFFLFYW